jgi:hypothetical protein
MTATTSTDSMAAAANAGVGKCTHAGKVQPAVSGLVAKTGVAEQKSRSQVARSQDWSCTK